MSEAPATYAAATAEAGTNEKYAPTHQFGAAAGEFGTTRTGRPIPFGNIPARPFLGISQDDKTEILSIINAHLATAVT